jgi:hypothetical protein
VHQHLEDEKNCATVLRIKIGISEPQVREETVCASLDVEKVYGKCPALLCIG